MEIYCLPYYLSSRSLFSEVASLYQVNPFLISPDVRWQQYLNPFRLQVLYTLGDESCSTLDHWTSMPYSLCYFLCFFEKSPTGLVILSPFFILEGTEAQKGSEQLSSLGYQELESKRLHPKPGFQWLSHLGSLSGRKWNGMVKMWRLDSNSVSTPSWLWHFGERV